jgi:hypothetical protein
VIAAGGGGSDVPLGWCCIAEVLNKPGVRKDILEGILKYFISIKTKHRNREPTLILALTKIRPRIEVLACQKHAQTSH